MLRHARIRSVLLVLVLLVGGVAPSTGAIPAVAATSATAGDVIARMTARWSAFTDSTGAAWAARSGTLGTNRVSTYLVGKPISGTSEPALYQVNATGVTGYSTRVPRAGAYKVRVLTAEEYYTAAGKRVFDVTAEGKVARAGVDIFAAVGKAAAYDVTFTTDVTDGTLDLGFVASKDAAVVTAIEVTYAGDVSMPAETFAYRMTTASQPVTDSQGRLWAPKTPHLTDGYTSSKLVGQDIAGTRDDALYATNAWGVRSWTVQTPVRATYRVRLLMAEDHWKLPGQRVFDVVAEGRKVLSRVDAVAGSGGPATAYDVAFDVPVTDGRLSLQFTSLVDNAAISAVEVTSADPALRPAGTPAARALALSPDSFYTSDISSAPTADDSTAVVADLARQVASQWEGVAAVNAYHYNTAFYSVSADTPKVTVAFDDCTKKGYLPNGLYDGPKYFVDVPVPADAQPAVGTDGEMTIYDASADKVWEFWKMARRADGGWQACWGGRIDDLSRSQGIFPNPYGASASGLLMAAGMITMDEARHGRIEHAMYLAVPDARALVASWPANRTDGNVADRTDLVAEGQRLRLDPSIDVDSLGLKPFAAAVAKAAQKYGFVVSDRAGAVAVVTESGATVRRETGSDPWDGLLDGPSYEALRGFPWHKLQALPMDYGRPA